MFRLLIFAAALGGLIALLTLAFPGVLSGTDAQMELVYSLLLITVVGGSIIVTWSHSFGTTLRWGLVWIAMFAALVAAYTYRDDMSGVLARMAGSLMPHRAQVTDAGEVVLTRDQSGHFRVVGSVNGTPVNFLVDTGASDVALSAADAKRVGFDPATLSYTRPYSTANGVVHAAPVTLGDISIGPITKTDVPASVSRAGLSHSLLGESFLSQLSGYSVQGDKLILKN